MAIELKQNLKLSQQLVITPQLQQAIKLLQLSRLELVDMVNSELMENPILEEVTPEDESQIPEELAQELEPDPLSATASDTANEVGTKDGELVEPKEFDWENYLDTYNTPGHEAQRLNLDEIPNYENMVTKSASLSEHLIWQLHMTQLTEEEEQIGCDIIESLDDNGYLTISPTEIASQYNHNQDDVDEVLKVIREFDPAGIASGNLQECLLAQVRFFGLERPFLEILIKEHLGLLERKDYPTIAKKMKIPVSQVAHLAQIITDLEPKPGRPFDSNNTQYITPDVYVHKVAHDYVIVLNDEGMPKLHISGFYREMILSSKKDNPNDSAAKNYIEDKLKKAMWLIKSIHQRQKTIYRVSKCIIEAQRDFLDHGVSQLKPMILKDVAERIGVHESTVSRATSNKYIHTPQGLFELKYFFSSRVQSDDIDGVASEAVKEKIKKLIAAESPKKPLSDKEIADLLEEAHIHIARRTVAKYREMLGILPSPRRRRLY